MLNHSFFRYGKNANTHDLIKVIAIAAMIIDHVGGYLLHNQVEYRLIGRAAAPLFFFLIGYNKVHIRALLIIYGIILSITGSLMTQHVWINILINFILIHFVLHFYPPQQLSTLKRSFFFIIAASLSSWVNSYLEYGLLGLLIAGSARLKAKNDPQAEFWLLNSLLIYLFWESVLFRFMSYSHIIPLFAGLIGCLFAVMCCYRLHELPYSLPLVRLLSRYSLSIYFFHLLVLQLFYLKRHLIL